MKKSTKILAAICAVALAFGATGCDVDSFPDFINPTDSTTVIKSEKYVINVQSKGGLPLDGVQVTATRGDFVRRGISKDGKIEFGIPLGEYDLQVDASTLPAGYYVEENAAYKTNPDKREEVTIQVPSKVITDGDNVYGVGHVMKDFTFTDCFNTRYTLSKLLETKKAVVVNFFFTACNPCRAEFPAIQTAYAGRSDIEILAIASTHQGDTNSDVQTFKEGLGLTFPMGVDTIGMNANFNVGAWPTTIVIDRYGLIAYKSSGTDTVASNWTRLFNDFTSDNYKQNFVAGGGEDQPGETPREIPNIPMPSSSTLGAAANGAGFSALYSAENDEYSWPWLASPDGYIYSSNKGKDNSYAIVNLEFKMETNQVLTFEYSVSSEVDKDALHILLDGEPMSGISGFSATNGWIKTNLYVAEADKTVVLSFVYQKDAGDPDGLDVEDVAKVRDIHLEDISAIREALDVMRPCASGLQTGSTTYENYTEIEENLRPGEKFYHTKDGALVYITLNQLTQWTNLHANGSTSVSPADNNTTYYNTLYYMTYYLYSQHETEFKVVIDGKDITDTVLTYWSIQGYMESPYYLLPLTEDLKEWAELFTAQHQKDTGRLPNADEWKEFCYYYDHYGSDNNEHTKEGDHCRKTTEVTRGLTIINPYTAYEKSQLTNLDSENAEDAEILNSATYNKATGRNKALIDYPLALNNGAYYEFTPAETGIYQIRSYTRNCSSAQAEPGLTVYLKDGSIYSWASDEPRELDAQINPDKYEGFNHFVKFEAGKTYYLHLGGSNSETSYYDFEIEYLNKPTHTEMYVATTGGGIWTVNPDTGKSIYIAVSVTYDDATDCYYRADARGNAIFEQPIYIDMIYHSYLMSNLASQGYNFQTLEVLIEDEIFKDKIPFGASYQKKMRRYLAQATEGSESDPLYGLVPANKEIVDILKRFLAANVDSTDTSTNGWLMFACYEERFGF